MVNTTKNLINTLWTKNHMGCKEVERKELYWTDMSFKENSYLICNTSYCKLWPPPPLSVQYKNSAFRRSLCHIVNYDSLLLGRHQMIIYGFSLSLIWVICLYWKSQERQHIEHTPMYLDQHEESIAVHGTWAIMEGTRYPEKILHSCGKPGTIFFCGSISMKKQTGPALDLHKLCQRAAVL